MSGRLTLNRSSSAWVPDWSWNGPEGRGSGPVPGAARCCKAAALLWRGLDRSAEEEGPGRRCWGGRSTPPGETRPRSLEGCAQTPADEGRTLLSLLGLGKGIIFIFSGVFSVSHRVFLWVRRLWSDDGVKAGGWERTEFLPHGSDLQQSSERWKTEIIQEKKREI